jgi:NAD(P)-dependent dehydrogenase (short-subunit alcohol dehydrogenase family)
MSHHARRDRTLLIGPDAPDVAATLAAVEASGAPVLHWLEPIEDEGDAVADALEALGGLDVIVRWTPRPRQRSRWSDGPAFAGDVDRMLVGAHRLAAAAARVMADTRDEGAQASLVFVGTVDASHAYPGRVSASVAMAGLLGLVRSLGVELASSGIRVNAVLVGPLGDAAGGPPRGVDGPTLERTRLRSPGGRFVTPREVAAAIRYVAGPQAAFMTGQALSVDVGWSALNQAPDGLRFP